MRDIVDRSIAENREYGGLVYRNPDGTYSYTEPKRGARIDETGQQFVKIPDDLAPKGSKPVGDYHTHGSNSDQTDTSFDCVLCNFSQQDMRGRDIKERLGYLGTPYGEVKKYTPDPNKEKKGGIDLLYSPYRKYPEVLRPCPQKK